MTPEILDRGPLFSRVRVTYDFDGGARYTATIKAPVSYSFIEFTEEMSGLTVEDQADFNLIWTDLKLTQREGDAPILHGSGPGRKSRRGVLLPGWT